MPPTAKGPSASEVPAAAADDGGGGGGRWKAESTASRTLTTHSSPCDVSDREDDEPQPQDDTLTRQTNQQPAASSKVVDASVLDMNSMGDYYRSADTPRAATRREGSVRSIQIQIESGESGLLPPSSRRRDPWRPRSRPTDKRAPSWRASCWALLVQTLVVVGPTALVLVLLHYSVAYTMLVVLNVVVALAGWEWSWWSYRIRRRLLAPIQFDEATASTENLDELQHDVLNHETLAIAALLHKWKCATTSKHAYLIAAVTAVVASAAATAIAMAFAGAIVPGDRSDVGERVLFASALTASLTVTFCMCLVAVPADAFILLVYEACFVVSSLNSFLAHHEHLIHDPELLDSMYVLLVGSCAIVVWRIVSSEEVMESTIMAMLDIVGLTYLIAPMMAMADFLGRPTVKDYGDIVGTFFVVVSAAEAAYRLNRLVNDKYPRLLENWRHPVNRKISKSLSVESIVLSVAFAVVGAFVSMMCFPGYDVDWEDALVYLGSVLMSQFCRLALESMKMMAKVDAGSTVSYKPWFGGCMEMFNPFLLAMIVFHPYVKALIKS